MKNSYDEIKDLLKKSNNINIKNRLSVNEVEQIIKNLINEQEFGGDTSVDNGQTTKRDNIAKSVEKKIDDDTRKKDKQQAYRVSGGVIVLHGKDQQDVLITTDEKNAFQETMEEFVNEVSELVDFYPLNVFSNNVEWSGKVIDMDVEFFFTIGENNGIYVNGLMMRVDDEFVSFTDKIQSYFNKFKTKWAKVLANRKKTKKDNEKQVG
jgi:hypothetical protein